MRARTATPWRFLGILPNLFSSKPSYSFLKIVCAVHARDRHYHIKFLNHSWIDRTRMASCLIAVACRLACCLLVCLAAACVSWCPSCCCLLALLACLLVVPRPLAFAAVAENVSLGAGDRSETFLSCLDCHCRTETQTQIHPSTSFY